MLRDDSRILAIEPDTYREWLAQVKETNWTAETLEELRGPAAATRLQPGRRNIGNIAVTQIGGFISQKPSLMSMLFGGTSTEALVAELRQLVAERSVGAIVLDVASPGGSVFGVPEAAAAIRALRGVKPIIAVSNPMMASAAYYLAAQADEIVATPSSLTGSIGTMSVFVDETQALEQAGLRVEVFTHGERKAEESGLRPLTDTARESIQARVDYYGAMFEADVAKARGVSPAAVRSRFGQGAVFNAEDAVAAGLIDRIGVLEDVIAELASGRKPRARVAAEDTRVQQSSWRLRMGLTDFRRSGVE